MKYINNRIRRAMALMAVMVVATATALAQTAVKYIDKNGVEQTCSTYNTVEDGEDATWSDSSNDGWYVVIGTNVIITNSVTVNGAVKLILADGAKLTVTGATNKAGITVSGTGNSLTIYGQIAGIGVLNATGGDKGAGIGGGKGQDSGDITINGGTITANGTGGGAGIGGGLQLVGGIGGSIGDIVINHGTVVASGSLLATGIGAGAMEPNYICFEAVQAGSTINLTSIVGVPSDISYSTDGDKWDTFSGTVTLTNVGDKCYFKTSTPRNNLTVNYYGMFEVPSKFECSGGLKVSGDIMTLLNGDNPSTEMIDANDRCFEQLFQNCTATIDASDLVLPATKLAANCYNSMFAGCDNLTKAPTISATEVAANCCNSMFSGCTSLENANNITLWATTLAEGCYQQMFDRCTKLETAPVLKAETLASNSCNQMFSVCSSLKETPAMTIKAVANDCCKDMFCGCTSLEDASNISLSATTLAANCYFGMFGLSSTSACCSSLKKAPAMSATEAANNCCDQMFRDCKNLVDVSGITFATTLADGCYNCMFEGCTSLETAPASLPATTLKDKCYIGMFSNCTNLKTVPDMSAIETVATSCCDAMFMGCSSLETAPDLKAATLAPNCYLQMFSGCTKLTTAPDMSAIEEVATYCCSAMFYGCSSLETAPVLKAETLVERCYYGMFNGCKKLSSVTMLATDISATDCLNSWLYNAGTSADSRTVYVASGMVDAVKNEVPDSWKPGVQVKP